ncbi:MAG TPA: hypothetical protein VGK13_06875 [Methanocellaceae archaeon]
MPRDRAERPSSESKASEGMRRWPGNERAVSSARCLGLAKGGERSEADRGCKPDPDIEAPEKPQQAGQQAGRRTA